jgi:pyruvate dehydrogenase E2 component (dihydrolipoamide acetyltransferase)
MTIPITIPRLGWNMETGVFVGWLKPDGAAVTAGEALFSLESDKATEDVECLDGGTLSIATDAPRPGDRVAVGTVIGHLLSAGETAPARGAGGPPAEPESRGAGCTTNRAGQPAISPRARRVAAELGVDWAALRGSGRTGRIRERDVRAAAPAPAGGADTSIRRTIAERMVASRTATAPVTLTSTADATNLVNLRDQFKAAGPAGAAVVPGFTDFLVKLTAISLQKHPRLNARWDGAKVEESVGIHIGFAVDTDAGVLVPVLRDVTALGLKQLAALSRELTERARQRQLTAAEQQGGTFTVTNLGAYGVDAFTPIINPPECAILGMGRIQRRPVVVGEQIVAREQVTLSLTFDHRIVDGAPAARFLQTLCALIENPGPWLVA